MLILCPECGLQVSDIATSCPHCGYPLTPKPQIPVTQPVQQKRMHLPNGFGSISEIHSKRLRKPFYVTVPAGKTPEGRPVRKPLKPISYFKTYNEAYQALVAYHRDPYDPETNITFRNSLTCGATKKKRQSKRSLSVVFAASGDIQIR